MRPFSTGGTYLNFLTRDEGEERVREAYRGNFERLKALKQEYDPDNIFQSNWNILAG